MTEHQVCNSCMTDFDKKKTYHCSLEFRHKGLHKQGRITWDDKAVVFR